MSNNNNVEELNVSNLGGVPVNKQDFFRIDSLDFVKSLNVELGTTEDPNYSHFQRFADELKSANVELIQLDNIAEEPTYENVDLTGAYFSQHGTCGLLSYMLKISERAIELANKGGFNVCSPVDEFGYAIGNENNTWSLGDAYRSKQIMEMNRND